MAIYRVAADPVPDQDWWPTSADECFYCAKPLIAGDLAVTWMSVGGFSYWHVNCAKDWAPAFMRDVWEADTAIRKPPADPNRYGPDAPSIPFNQLPDTQ